MADGIYPMMQLLDEEYLGADAEFGGMDQRKAFALSHDTMAKVGFKVRAHLMNPMVPGLAGGKMSSSDPKSKIDLLDDAETIRKKIAKAQCPPRTTQGNGILAFIQHVVLPYSELLSVDGKASINVVLKDHTEPSTLRSFAEVEAAYESDSLTPQLAKMIVQNVLVKLTEFIRRDFAADQEWQEIAITAYPDASNSNEKKQDNPAKEKSKKNKGLVVPVVDQ